jgi:DNA-directed RNA polymerase subunit RPC12/RpoP
METSKQLNNKKQNKMTNKICSICKKEATCLTCGHTWQTKSQYVYVNCPCCRSPVKINEVKHGKD